MQVLFLIFLIVGMLLYLALWIGLIAGTIWGISATVCNLLSLFRVPKHAATPLVRGVLTCVGLIGYVFWLNELFQFRP